MIKVEDITVETARQAAIEAAEVLTKTVLAQVIADHMSTDDGGKIDFVKAEKKLPLEFRKLADAMARDAVRMMHASKKVVLDNLRKKIEEDKPCAP